MTKIRVVEESSLWERLKTIEKPIVLYGMGNGAEKIRDVLLKRGIHVDGIFASEGFVRGQYFYEHKVIAYEDVVRRFPDMVILTAFGSHRDEVIKKIYSLAEMHELYAPDVPVYGDELFDMEFFLRHEPALEEVYDRLKDEASKQAFCDIMNYKISGKLCYLKSSETSPEEAMEKVLGLGNEEIFVDVGAYTGDTILKFQEYVEDYRGIYAIEPDEKNYVKLKKNTSDMHNIEYINAGVSKDHREVGFSQSGSRGSVLDTDAARVAKFYSIDSLLQGREATYIKYDIEGREKEALLGTKNTIKRYKPKMLVSTYHRSEDLYTLPQVVLNIREDYDLYFRRYPCVPAWDMNYYFV